MFFLTLSIERANVETDIILSSDFPILMSRVERRGPRNPPWAPPVLFREHIFDFKVA